MTLVESPSSWWNCPFDPYSHLFMTEVQGKRMSDVLPHCVNSDQNDTLFPIDRMIILRDPIERLVSAWLFTLGNYVFHMRHVKPEVIKEKNLVVPKKIFNSSMFNISKDEVAHFHSLNRYTYSYSSFLAGSPSPKARLKKKKVMKKKKKKKKKNSQKIEPSVVTDRDMLPNATKVLTEDYTLFGTTEMLPSLFVYLSCRYGLNISATCDKFITRNVGDRNFKYFGSADRPPASTLFNNETFAYLQEIVQPDYVLWQTAQLKHVEQLGEYGYTVQSATEAWQQHCGSGFTHKSNSYIRGVMQ